MLKSLSSEQFRAGHAVGIAAVLDEEAPPHAALEAAQRAGVEVREVRVAARAYRRERDEIRDIVSTFDPDVVHTHGYRADVLHGGVARNGGIPAVTTVHGFTGGDLKNRLYEWLQRRAYRRYDAVVAVSRPLRAQLMDGGVPRDRLRWIPNAWAGGVDFVERSEARRQLGLDPEAPLAGFVGRLGREKGADTFARAVAEMNRAAAGVMLGDGRLRKELEQLARDPRMRGRLRLLGLVPAAGRLMKALDVFVLSSRTEGTPIALFEAVAAGVPVVATRVGGVPDVVSEREAILVEPDRPAELAAAVDAVFSDRSAAEARAACARARLVEEFGAARWVERYDAVYDETGRSTRRGAG